MQDTAQGYLKCVPPHIGVCSCGVDGQRQSRDYYITPKISWLDRLPNLLSNGALLACYVCRLCYKENWAIILVSADAQMVFGFSKLYNLKLA